MNGTARGIMASIAVLVALVATVVMASTAQAADSTAVRPDVHAVAVHTAYEAGAGLQELLPVSFQCSEASAIGDDEHWYDDAVSGLSEAGDTGFDEHWYDDAVSRETRCK